MVLQKNSFFVRFRCEIFADLRKLLVRRKHTGLAVLQSLEIFSSSPALEGCL